MEKISVIIPVYNAQETIRQTVESIKNQTWENWEIILINDGSKDNSLEVCRSLERENQDEKIRVIDKPNGGVVSAYKKGIQNATGTLISFCDADDLYKPDFLERGAKIIFENNCDFVSFACSIEDGTSSVTDKNAAAEGLYDKARIQKEILPGCLFNGFIPGEYYKVLVYRWNKVYKKELLDRFADQLDEKCFQVEDNIFTTLAILNANSFYIDNTSMYSYMLRPQSITTGCSDNLIDKYTYSLSVIKSLTDRYLSEYNPKQFSFLAYENYRIVFRRIAKGAGYKTAKKALRTIRNTGFIDSVRLSDIKLLKNYLFYALYHTRMDMLLYLSFKAL